MFEYSCQKSMTVVGDEGKEKLCFYNITVDGQDHWLVLECQPFSANDRFSHIPNSFVCDAVLNIN